MRTKIETISMVLLWGFVLLGIFCALQNDSIAGEKPEKNSETTISDRIENARKNYEDMTRRPPELEAGIRKLRAYVDSLTKVLSTPKPANYVYIRFGKPGDRAESPFQVARVFIPALKVYGFECVAGGPVEFWIFKTIHNKAVSDSLLNSLGLEVKCYQ